MELSSRVMFGFVVSAPWLSLSSFGYLLGLAPTSFPSRGRTGFWRVDFHYKRA